MLAKCAGLISPLSIPGTGSKAEREIVEKRKDIDGERMLQSGKKHLRSVKEEEGGSGPPTFWRTLNGPKIVHEEVILVSDDDN